MNDITLRDHIAVETLKALIMEPQWDDQPNTVAGGIYDTEGLSGDDVRPQTILAVAAYALADAMLAERERGA